MEKFKYFVIVFTSDGRWNKESDTGSVRENQFCANLVNLWWRRGSLKYRILSVLKLSFVLTLRYSHESWVMTGRVLSQKLAVKMGISRKLFGVTLRDKTRRCEIRKAFLSRHFSECKGSSYDSSVICHECPRKWHRDLSCWLHLQGIAVLLNRSRGRSNFYGWTRSREPKTYEKQNRSSKFGFRYHKQFLGKANCTNHTARKQSRGDQRPSGVTTTPAWFDTVCVWSQRKHLRFLKM